MRFPTHKVSRHSITLKRASIKLLSGILSSERIHKKLRMISTLFQLFSIAQKDELKKLSDLWIDLLMIYGRIGVICVTSTSCRCSIVFCPMHISITLLSWHSNNHQCLLSDSPSIFLQLLNAFLLKKTWELNNISTIDASDMSNIGKSHVRIY